jgi:hypothetical protein
MCRGRQECKERGEERGEKSKAREGKGVLVWMLVLVFRFLHGAVFFCENEATDFKFSKNSNGLATS